MPSFQRPTYDQLFSLLAKVGFLRAESGSFERAFLHEETDTVLLFSLLDDPNTDRPVREADFASAEAHLLGKAIIRCPLQQVLETFGMERLR